MNRLTAHVWPLTERPWPMGSPHTIFFVTEGEGDKGGFTKGRELAHWG